MALSSRGEVWLVDLDPTRGHEQGKTRPGLVVSVDLFNHGPAGLVVVIPLTTTDRRIPLHIEVSPPDGNLDRRSFVQCDQPHCVSRERLVRRIGTVSQAVIQQVEDRLRILLGL